MATEAIQRRQRVAPLLVVRASGHLSDGQRRYPRWELTNAELQRLLAEGVGGVILLGASAAELGQRSRQLASWSEQPLLLCADVEEGVGQRFEGASWLVPPLALGRIHAADAAVAQALHDVHRPKPNELQWFRRRRFAHTGGWGAERCDGITRRWV